jgi:NADH-quinone oxidoreductase subunit M
MIPVLLIAIPLVAGILGFFAKNQSKNIAWFASLATLGVMLYAFINNSNMASSNLEHQSAWLTTLGASFHVGLDGVGKVLCLLTAFTFPIIFLGTSNNNYKNEGNYYALMLLAQAGLMGVFVAMDGLLFYFFWELALIPVYFLSSIWGGEKRIAATFKFFIYTFIGSLFMLIGLIYLANQTPSNSFDIHTIQSLVLPAKQQNWVFFLFFIAFAIKMPIFPLHTWQPDAYQQAPTSTTMVLSAVMVKMGLFGVIRWLIPITPNATIYASTAIIVFCIIGIIYASLIATKQNNIKRLVAYSSIAHIGLMCATLFTNSSAGLEGVIMQMFHHGINILGLWLVVDMIEKRTGIQKMSELGGLAKTSPTLAIFLVIIALANIGLPLTNAFVGEFLMFNALFNYNVWMAAFAGLGIILAAVYTLGMIQKVFYGTPNTVTQKFGDITINEKVALTIVVLFILTMGVYSEPFGTIIKDTVAATIIKK